MPSPKKMPKDQKRAYITGYEKGKKDTKAKQPKPKKKNK